MAIPKYPRGGEPTLYLRTPDAALLINRRMRRVLMRALSAYIRDQHGRIGLAESEEHRRARGVYLRNALELAGFLAAAGVYASPDEERTMSRAVADAIHEIG